MSRRPHMLAPHTHITPHTAGSRLGTLTMIISRVSSARSRARTDRSLRPYPHPVRRWLTTTCRRCTTPTALLMLLYWYGSKYPTIHGTCADGLHRLHRHAPTHPFRATTGARTHSSTDAHLTHLALGKSTSSTIHILGKGASQGARICGRCPQRSALPRAVPANIDFPAPSLGAYSSNSQPPAPPPASCHRSDSKPHGCA